MVFTLKSFHNKRNKTITKVFSIMKKIIGIAILAVVVIGGVLGFNYYQKTYSGHEAYAKVPTTVPEKHETKDASGHTVDGSYSYDYTFTFVNDKGEKTQMDYELSGDVPKPLTPGAYISAEISETRIVNGPNDIAQDKIPTKALDVLNAND